MVMWTYDDDGDLTHVGGVDLTHIDGDSDAMPLLMMMLGPTSLLLMMMVTSSMVVAWTRCGLIMLVASRILMMPLPMMLVSLNHDDVDLPTTHDDGVACGYSGQKTAPRKTQRFNSALAHA